MLLVRSQIYDLRYVNGWQSQSNLHTQNKFTLHASTVFTEVIMDGAIYGSVFKNIYLACWAIGADSIVTRWKNLSKTLTLSIICLDLLHLGAELWCMPHVNNVKVG